MAIKVFEKEYPEQFFAIQYTMEIIEMVKIGKDSLRITGRLVPSWLYEEDQDIEKFDKYQAEFQKMQNDCDAFVKRSPQEVIDKKAFGVVMEMDREDWDAETYLAGGYDDGS